MNKITYKVYIALCITIILWASAFVGIRIGLRAYSPGSMALLRYAVASLCMLVLYLHLPNRHKVTLRDLPPLVLAGILGFTIYNIALNYGELTVSAGIASFIIGLTPIFTLILAVIFLKEKTSWLAMIGIAISLIGVTLISLGEHGGIAFNYGVIYTLIGALVTSLYIILQKYILKKFHPIEATAFAIWIGTAGMLFYLPQLIHELPQANWQVTATVIYLGIFPAAISYALWNYALVFMPAATVARYLYTLPIVTTIMGWLLINEIPAFLSVIGGLISLIGAIIANQSRSTIKQRDKL